MSTCYTNCVLYNKIKDRIVVNYLDKNLCSGDCHFADSKINYCKLFDEITPYTKRCKDCIDIFGG
jgi:hypothetical protein